MRLDDDDLRHWDSARIRENHDIDHDWVAQEEELERWLGYTLGALALLGVWKVLDLGYALARWILS